MSVGKTRLRRGPRCRARSTTNLHRRRAGARSGGGARACPITSPPSCLDRLVNHHDAVGGPQLGTCLWQIAQPWPCSTVMRRIVASSLRPPSWLLPLQ
jgi:hypothetical protein